MRIVHHKEEAEALLQPRQLAQICEVSCTPHAQAGGFGGSHIISFVPLLGLVGSCLRQGRVQAQERMAWPACQRQVMAYTCSLTEMAAI